MCRRKLNDNKHKVIRYTRRASGKKMNVAFNGELFEEVE